MQGRNLKNGKTGGKKMYNKKRILKRNKLIKKLFFELAKKHLNKKIYKFITISISDKNPCGANTRYYLGNNRNFVGVKYIKVYLNLYQLKSICSIGLNIEGNYYNNRHIFLNKYIKSNRHNLYRFVILHELYHIKKRLYIQNDIGYSFEELLCDRFAVDNLKK